MGISHSSTGFFGPSLLADGTLVVQILFYMVLSAGVVAQLQGRHRLHRWLQGPVVLLNLLFIAFVMGPTLRTVVTQSATGPLNLPALVAVAHAALGAVAQLLSIYCLLAGLNILPHQKGQLRYWMWAAYTAWTVAIVFGISTYLLFYVGLV